MLLDEETYYRVILQRSGWWKAYNFYLRSAHWFLTRQYILERDGYRCQACHVKARVLHIHHLSYTRLWREEDADLLTLCKRCHRLAHSRKK